MIILVEKLNLMKNFIIKLYPIYPTKFGLFFQKEVTSINLMESLFRKHHMKVKIYIEKIFHCQPLLQFPEMKSVAVIKIEKVVNADKTEIENEEDVSYVRKIKEMRKQQMIM